MLLRGGEQTAREGRCICKFDNGLDGVGAAEVITLAGIVYNIPENRRILISQLVLSLHTLSDFIYVDVGWTTAVNGAGVFTPLTIQHHLHTGNVQAAPQSFVRTFYPIKIAEYSEGARCVTLRVTANDVGAMMAIAWSGWWEFE